MKNIILTLAAAIILINCSTQKVEQIETKGNICFKWLNTNAEIPMDGQMVQIAYTDEDTVYLKPLTVSYGSLTFNNVTEYKNFLIQEGYTKKASELIAKTEFKLIPEGAEYNALMED